MASACWDDGVLLRDGLSSRATAAVSGKEPAAMENLVNLQSLMEEGFPSSGRHTPFAMANRAGQGCPFLRTDSQSLCRTLSLRFRRHHDDGREIGAVTSGIACQQRQTKNGGMGADEKIREHA